MFKNRKEKLSPKGCQESLAAVQDALYVLNGKWKIAIIIALSHGNKRFGEIQKSVEGIAPKVLSSELKNLEMNGFVTRTVYNEFPVLVEYELTEYSNSLESVITALRDWGLQHRDRIKNECKEKRAKSAETEPIEH